MVIEFAYGSKKKTGSGTGDKEGETRGRNRPSYLLLYIHNLHTEYRFMMPCDANAYKDRQLIDIEIACDRE